MGCFATAVDCDGPASSLCIFSENPKAESNAFALKKRVMSRSKKIQLI